jgi:hypothetical protein
VKPNLVSLTSELTKLKPSDLADVLSSLSSHIEWGRYASTLNNSPALEDMRFNDQLVEIEGMLSTLSDAVGNIKHNGPLVLGCSEAVENSINSLVPDQSEQDAYEGKKLCGQCGYHFFEQNINKEDLCTSCVEKNKALDDEGTFYGSGRDEEAYDSAMMVDED